MQLLQTKAIYHKFRLQKTPTLQNVHLVDLKLMLFHNFDIRCLFPQRRRSPFFQESDTSIYKVLHLPGLTAALPDNKVEIAISVQLQLQAPLCVSVLDRSVLGINTEHIKGMPLAFDLKLWRLATLHSCNRGFTSPPPGSTRQRLLFYL